MSTLNGIEAVELLSSADPAAAAVVRNRGRRPVVERTAGQPWVINGIEGVIFGTESSGPGSVFRLDSADPAAAQLAQQRGQRAIVVVDSTGSAIPATLAGSVLDTNFAANKAYLNGTVTPITTLVTCVRAAPATTYAETAAGAWTSFAANTLRQTDKGVLIEESRTQILTNSAGSGATVGTEGAGGVLPTTWVADTTATQKWEIVGTGTESGIDYIDFRFHTDGVNNDRGYVALFPSSASGITPGTAVAVAQVYTSSWFLKVTAGTAPTAFGIITRAFNVSSAQTEQTFSSDGAGSIARGSQAFGLSRSSGPTLTIADATSTKLTTFLQIGSLSTSAPFDFTVRIGWPQLELGAFATSPIRTTSAAVTRDADVVKTADISWLNASAGTLYAEGGPHHANFTGGTNQALVSLDDGTNNERIQVRKDTITANARMTVVIVDGGAVQFSNTLGTGTWGDTASHKCALTYAANDVIACDNGTLTAADVAATLPTVTQCQLGNGQALGYLNGYLKRMAYANSRLPDATLQAWTT